MLEKTLEAKEYLKGDVKSNHKRQTIQALLHN